MANIMNPVLPVASIERSVQPVKVERDSGNTFSDHLDRKIQDQKTQNDRIGQKQREARREGAERASRNDTTEREDAPEPGQESHASDVLALFMQDLQQIAQDNGVGVGEWVTSIEGADFLQGMAENAGMSEMELLALTERFQQEDGSLDLPSFFQTMQAHFADFKPKVAVLVPETELPQLESLLTKMGLSQEQLADLSNKVTVGDNQLDLAAFNDALGALLNDASTADQVIPVILSEAEVEQLQDLLAQAGMQLGDQLELLPETLLGQDVVLSLERLQGMIDQGVNQAQQAAPKVDLAAFLKDLESVMQSAKFVDQSAGITPLVQNSLIDAYKSLVAMLDDMQRRFDEGLSLEDANLTEDMDKWRAGVAERLANLTGMDADNITVQTTMRVGSDSSPNQAQTSLSGGAESATPFSTQAMPQSVEQAIQANAGDQPPPTRHFSTQQQQQIFNQLSLAVARGMKSGEHHLTLRLHPVELGDVKVDLVMKGSEISAHFNIANSRVKETLETSMQEFRQEMEQKGFTMGELNVSVGGQDNPEDGFQRFEMAWSGERLQAETLDDLPGGTLYHHGMQEQYANPEQGVNLFV